MLDGGSHDSATDLIPATAVSDRGADGTAAAGSAGSAVVVAVDVAVVVVVVVVEVDVVVPVVVLVDVGGVVVGGVVVVVSTGSDEVGVAPAGEPSGAAAPIVASTSGDRNVAMANVAAAIVHRRGLRTEVAAGEPISGDKNELQPDDRYVGPAGGAPGMT